VENSSQGTQKDKNILGLSTLFWIRTRYIPNKGQTYYRESFPLW